MNGLAEVAQQTATCESCRFYNKPVHARWAECRRYPPETPPSAPDAVAMFPLVSPRMWCGEYVH